MGFVDLTSPKGENGACCCYMAVMDLANGCIYMACRRVQWLMAALVSAHPVPRNRTHHIIRMALHDMTS